MESVLMDHRSHIFVYECGGVAAHAQAQIKPVTPLSGGKWKGDCVRGVHRYTVVWPLCCVVSKLIAV